MQKVLFVLLDKISFCTYTVAKPQAGSGRQHSFPSQPLCALSASLLPRPSLPDTHFILTLAVIFSDFRKCNFDFFPCYKPSVFKRECRTLLLFTSSLSFTVLNCFLQIFFLFSNSFFYLPVAWQNTHEIILLRSNLIHAVLKVIYFLFENSPFLVMTTACCF